MIRHIAYLALLALLLTTAFAGCRQEPLPESGDAIRFTVVPATVSFEETKADDGRPHDRYYLEQTTTPATLYGSYTVQANDSPVSLFDGVTLTCTEVSATGSTWTYTPSRYWVQNGKHIFRAVFPKKDGQSYNLNEDELYVVYSMLTGYDLMVASAKQDAATPVNDKVTLPFVHANAAVRICFKDANGANTDPDYEITSLKLCNLQPSSTLTYKGVTETTTASIVWSPGTRETTAYSWAASAVDPAIAVTPATGEEYATFKDWFYVVPQALVVAGEEG